MIEPKQMVVWYKTGKKTSGQSIDLIPIKYKISAVSKPCMSQHQPEDTHQQRMYESTHLRLSDQSLNYPATKGGSHAGARATPKP